MKDLLAGNKLIFFIVLLCNTFSAVGQLTGIKTVPGNYATITLAVADVNALGVGAGGVTFNIAAGYTQTIDSTISLTATGNASNPIIFQKDPATTGANPLITSYAGGVGTPKTAKQDGIWRLIGSDYVTISGIDITDNPANTTNPSTMEYGYALYKASSSNGCQYVTIENCVVTLSIVNNAAGTVPMVDGSTGIIVMNATSIAAVTPISSAAGGQNSNNRFYSNTIQHCNIGIAIAGYAASSPYTLADNNNDVGGNAALTGNTIINFGGAAGSTVAAAGIQTSAQYGLNVSYNTINNNNGSGANHPFALRGIFINTATSANTNVTFNTVTIKGGGDSLSIITGIQNAAGSTPASNLININNNTITNCIYTAATSGHFYGIYNTGSPTTISISNNTISNNSSAAISKGLFYGIYNYSAATTANINSNLLTGNSTGVSTGLFAGIYNALSAPNVSISNNTIAGSATATVAGVYYAIYNKASVATSFNIDANNIGTSLLPAVTFTALNSGAHIFINDYINGLAVGLSISNNHFYNVVYSIGGTGTNTYIYNKSSTLTQNISNNTFNNMNVNTTNSITFISTAGVSTSGTQNVNGNSIVGTFTKAGIGGIVTLFTSTSTSLSASTYNNNDNNFSGITVSGTSTIAGWVNTDAGVATKNIQNNIFSNWVGGTGSIIAMNVNLTSANNSTTGNVISNISSAGIITGITTGGTTGNDNIYTNTINSLYSSGTPVTGIAITSGATKKIYRNKIFDLQSTSAAGLVNGILSSGTTTAVITANISNNLIGDLRTPVNNSTDGVRGISITSTRANSSVNVYFNTVYLNATSTGTNFGTSGIYHSASATATTGALTLSNNSITNISIPNGSGVTAAYRRSGIARANYNLSSNNNLLYAGAASATRLLFFDGTNRDQTITAFKLRVTTADAQSVTEDISAKFLSTSGVSASFLRMNPSKRTQLESGAININGYATDADGDTRQGNAGYSGTGTSPDIGADEFEGTKFQALAGSYNVGIGQVYTSLTNADGLFSAINSVGLSGDVVVNVTSDLSEDGSNALFEWTEQGAGNYNLTIQPNSTTVRNITGNSLAGLIRFSGADGVTIDGSFSGSGRYLTFTNTNTAGTTGTAFSFISGATNNTLRYCNIGAFANAANGVLFFGTSTVGGNSDNLVEYCAINGTVAGHTSLVGIYSGGTAGNENSNTISNNSIYNYQDRGLDIPATGSTTWTINKNSFYNGDVAGSVNYGAGSAIHGIRILGGAGYNIVNNAIGGSAPATSGTTAVYGSTLGILSYQGILLTTTNASPASAIKGNTIANISLSTVATSTSSTAFHGIETNGFGINVGGSAAGEGNTIGSNTTNGSILITTTTTSATYKTTIRGISYNSSGGLVIGNQVGSLDIKNIGLAPGPSTFIGIYVNNASAPPLVNNNIVGSTGSGAALNSIRVLSSS
ncbi:MAG: hypothetical protein ABIN89_15755, partial [Chitinophagaceae bacterium]